MENLKSAIPETLKRTIGDTISGDLPRSCSSLLDFLLHFPPFHQIVEDLASSEKALCGKNKDEALELKSKANRCFAAGDFSGALVYYFQALRVAPLDAIDAGKNLVAMLFLNRAFVFYKMNLLSECVRDCNRALQISSSYAKAWYRRGMANASLGNYKESINDFNVAKTLETSSGGKTQIETELTRLLNRQSRIISQPLKHTPLELRNLDDPPKTKLQIVSTPDKARGMASMRNIPPASLVHIEEPFAAIILKSCRETHCHYCFNELPVDKVPCMFCSIPLYCSEYCRLRAKGKLSYCPKGHGIQENLRDNLEKYVTEITSCADSETNVEHIPEHEHECRGGSWPLVLPSEIVLAGRVFVKLIMQRRGSLEVTNLIEILELAHHYSKMSPKSKLELHIYSAVLLCCLERSRGHKIPVNGFSMAQAIILISQIRVNSMSIVRIKSIEVQGVVNESGKSLSQTLTSNVEQVKVGQAIYEAGSLFNHSCQPNVHAYFLSRTLFIRTIEFVPAGCPLELSYGPQIGQWDCKDRTRFLEDEYSFRCQCTGCSKTNLSDLLLNAFRCVKLNCSGIVLDSCVLNCEKHKIMLSTNSASTISLTPHLWSECLNNNDVNEAAVLDSNLFSDINPGYCLKCHSYCDLESSSVTVNEARKSIIRLVDAIASGDVSGSELLDASHALDLLKSTLHAYNRSIAEVEDTIAQASYLVGDLRSARDHTKASIKILEKLYTSNHIVIGHELVKLASIQLCLGDSTVIDSINRLDKIFTCYYGSHTDTVYPLLKLLRRETGNIVV